MWEAPLTIARGFGSHRAEALDSYVDMALADG
jgi:hypothetical protein